MNIILEEIIKNADPVYKEFHKKLIPTIPENTVLGARSPVCQAIAKRYAGTKEGNGFLHSLPHTYYDENMVHAFMLGRLKCDINEIQRYVIDFLPYVDNWAVCDGLCAHLKNFFKKPEDVYGFVIECTESDRAYTVRFGIVCLLNYYIDELHIDEILEICCRIVSEEYYINMALAWLISFCLIKQYDKTIKVIEGCVLPKWVHNKSIQKAIESYRIDKDKKEYLRSKRIK
ncbi:MAG: DNA alkylation repair protein [Ruminococcaceae bacterium]|nr:DNA alkylation repair protein [Oscillospiraceae bacterium]